MIILPSMQSTRPPRVSAPPPNTNSLIPVGFDSSSPLFEDINASYDYVMCGLVLLFREISNKIIGPACFQEVIFHLRTLPQNCLRIPNFPGPRRINMLCPRCEALCSLIDPIRDASVSHYGSVAEFSRSAELGCRLCRVITRACFEKSKAIDNRSSGVRLKLKRDIGIEVTLIETVHKPEHGSGNNARPVITYVAFESYVVPDKLESLLLREDSENKNTGSDVSFRLVSLWLDQCLNTHDKCKSSAENEPYLPRRVIDVGTCESSVEPYLLESAGQVGRYVTLSHCWGGGSPIMSTTDNIRQHKIAIRYVDFPRTFRDAIDVTRKLGCRYLWIDSLCIVQNDRSDWEREGTMMHQYYKQSLMTIAAVDAENSTAGLFRDRKGSDYQPCVLQVTSPGVAPRNLYAFTNSMSSDLKRSSFSGSFRSSRLYSRAWVFQEQALSPRTLSYARDRVFWRCQEMVFEERVPFLKPIHSFIKELQSGTIISRKADPRTIDANISRLQRENIFAKPCFPEVRVHSCIAFPGAKCFLDQDEFLIHWGNIVSEYTQRQLTYQTDKLLAIQGIADAMELVMSQPYYAGSWVGSARSIIMSLLWSSRRPKGESRRLDIAPSWSWASVEYEVAWPGHLAHQLETMITIVDLKRSGTTARCSGELTIIANMKRVIMKSGQLFPIPTQSDEVSRSVLNMDLTTISNQIRKSPFTTLLDEEAADNTIYWVAELAKGQTHNQQNQNQVHCLILAECEEKSLGYRRIGYCIYEEDQWRCSELPKSTEIQMSII